MVLMMNGEVLHESFSTADRQFSHLLIKKNNCSAVKFIPTETSRNFLWLGLSLIIIFLLSLKMIIIKSITSPISHSPLKTVAKICFY